MWPSKSRTETVTCLACGTERPRDEAREYDKHGDRWDRDGKTFEHLCKSCHGDSVITLATNSRRYWSTSRPASETGPPF